MGGLKKSLPITFLTYLAGALALMAVPPFSGFFSKDEILWSLFSSEHYALFAVALFTGFLTCFYMTRLTTYVFLGKQKLKPHKEENFLNLPLILLALLSLLAGVFGIPHLLSNILPFHPPHFLNEILRAFTTLTFQGPLWQEALIMLSSTSMGLIVIIGTLFYYSKDIKISFPSLVLKTLEEAFYVPHIIQHYIQPTFQKVSDESFYRIEQNLFNAFVSFLISQTLSLGKFFSKLQNGNLQSYALYFTIGLTVAMFLIFLR